MIVLGVDTSTDSLAVGLIDEKKILADYNVGGRLRHSSLLIPTIERALRKARIKIDDVDIFSVGTGPGSFTGLRVGVTAIRALAIALGKPIIGVPTMDAIAANGFMYLKRKRRLNDGIKICPVLDAKKKMLYACIYRQDGAKIIKDSRYLLEPVEKLVRRLKGEVLFLGDGIALYKTELGAKKTLKAQFLDGRIWLPKAGVIAKMALGEYRGGRRDDPYDLVPMYLYAQDCNVRKEASLKCRVYGSRLSVIGISRTP